VGALPALGHHREPERGEEAETKPLRLRLQQEAKHLRVNQLVIARDYAHGAQSYVLLDMWSKA
jgi:hypothetical protein